MACGHRRLRMGVPSVRARALRFLRWNEGEVHARETLRPHRARMCSTRRRHIHPQRRVPARPTSAHDRCEVGRHESHIDRRFVLPFDGHAALVGCWGDPTGGSPRNISVNNTLVWSVDWLAIKQQQQQLCNLIQQQQQLCNLIQQTILKLRCKIHSNLEPTITKYCWLRGKKNHL